MSDRIKIKVPPYLLQLLHIDVGGEYRPINYLANEFVIGIGVDSYRIVSLDRSTGDVYVEKIIPKN